MPLPRIETPIEAGLEDEAAIHHWCGCRKPPIIGKPKASCGACNGQGAYWTVQPFRFSPTQTKED